MSNTIHSNDISNTASQERREAISDLAKLAGKVILGGLPFILAATPKKAQAQTLQNHIDTLNQYLILPILKDDLYTKALASPSFDVPLQGRNRTIIEQLKAINDGHLSILQTEIIQLGGTPLSVPSIDWTGGSDDNGPGFGLGLLINDHSVFNSVAALFAMTQSLADLSVKMYKGELFNLLNNRSLVNLIMRLQSTDARIASQIRMMRRESGLAVQPGVNLKPWINRVESGLVGPFNILLDGIYANDGSTSLGSVNLLSATKYNADSVSQAIDESLTKTDVAFVLNAFID